MLSIKRLPMLSAIKVRTKFVNLKNTVYMVQLNEQCQNNFIYLCRSYSVLHNLIKKTIQPKTNQSFAEYKELCSLYRRIDYPGFNRYKDRNIAKQVDLPVIEAFIEPCKPFKQNSAKHLGAYALLQKSNHCGLYSKIIARGLHTTPPLNDEKDSKDKNDKRKENDKEEWPSLLMKAMFWMMTTCILVVASSFLLPSDNSQNELIRYVSWNEFVYSMLSKGEVEELIVRPDIEIVTIILHEGAVVKGKRSNHRVFHMNVGDIHRFEEKLREIESSFGVKEGVRVIYDRNGGVAGKLITTLLIGAVILSFLYSTKSMKMNMNIGGFSQLGRAKFTLVDSMSGQGKGVKFSDVAGLSEAKVEVMEFVDYLKRPEHYKSLGAKVPKGALLLGPPGCGKTLLAKAVATEANVPFLSMNGSEFIEMIGGLGAARVRDLFKEACARAPCIIYIDEMDAVGRARSSEMSGGYGPGGGEGEQTLNQLLVEMDGMKSREGVVVLASTNRADVLDKALLRPGRFDRHILIDLPTLLEREQIFIRHLKNIVLEKVPEYYASRLAYMTPGFSGADIANVCNEAALHAARYRQSYVRAANLEYAVGRLVGGIEKHSHAMAPDEKEIVAYHESGHALVGWLLEHTDALLKVTIVPRTNMALGYAQYTTSDQKLYSKEQLLDRMCMALGGRAAEAIIFNFITNGGQNDLEKVTKIAYAQVRKYGMCPTVGLVSFPGLKEHGKSPFSNTMKSLIDMEARKIISSAYFRTEQLLRANKKQLHILARELLKRETLDYKAVERILGPPRFPKKKYIEPVEFEGDLKNMEKAASEDNGAPPGNRKSGDHPTA